ncbi:MAG: A/G-specific adenine glycosylase [Flavobacteriales bacterium]|nr:A/G-specific adenine glycosylase [Flavobacteriales bacterium]
MPINSLFTAQIIDWYRSNKRDLPWRETQDPYKIWLSEIILQQTRVEQGLPYYERFLKAFPNLRDLANASEEQVLKLWQGLGYYSRGRNLLQTAKQVSTHFNGKFPETAEKLQQLTGIGPYTARAIASFAFNEEVAVVDGNVYRVLARVFGIFTEINSSAGKREFQELADALLPPENASEFNQALMEFGALQCTPRPDCHSCPLLGICIAADRDLVSQLPVKSKSKPKRDRHFNYLFYYDSGKILLRKRTHKDIWKNLYEFPLVEQVRATEDPCSVVAEAEVLYDLDLKALEVLDPHAYKHILSHQIIHIRIWPMRGPIPPNESLKSGIFAINLEELEKQYPVPVILHRFLEHIKPYLVSK